MDLFRAVKAKALLSVVKPNGAYYVRHIYRWYSETFHTPLHEVEGLDFADILQHYFERMYEEMDPPELVDCVKELSLSDEQKAVQAIEQDEQEAADEAFFKLTQAQAARQVKQEKPEPSLTPEQVALIEALKPRKMMDLPEIHMDFGNMFDDEDTMNPPKKP